MNNRKRDNQRLKGLIISVVMMLSIVSVAHAQPELNIYSLRQPFLIDPVLELFSQKTGVKINMIYAGKGLLARLEAEGEHSPADILITSDLQSLLRARDRDLLGVYQSQYIMDKVPEWLRDQDGRWVALTKRARIIYASKNRVAKNEVTHYEDLTDPKWKGRICIRSGKHPYNIGLISALMYHWGEDKTVQWLKGIKENLARKPQGNDRAQIKAVWQGICDIGVGNSYYYGRMLDDKEQKAWALSVNPVFVAINNQGVHMNVSGIAMTKSSKNRELAGQLIDFMVSVQAQEHYSAKNWEYPVHQDAKTHGQLDKLGTFKSDATNLERFFIYRKRASEIIDEIGFDQ